MGPNSAILSNRCFGVLCEGCVPVGDVRFDPGEQITLELMPVAELRDRVRDGTLRSGMMLVAIMWWLDEQGLMRWPS